MIHTLKITEKRCRILKAEKENLFHKCLFKSRNLLVYDISQNKGTLFEFRDNAEEVMLYFRKPYEVS